ncbi:formin-like protein 20 [Ursus americanus]|uniref:formin-like protein 20 n=1 Tax=Ursus americanus TaxID=9643 RepID=UPI001E67D370|nr:formin-like protein 20 [Ursus americanus]
MDPEGSEGLAQDGDVGAAGPAPRKHSCPAVTPGRRPQEEDHSWRDGPHAKGTSPVRAGGSGWSRPGHEPTWRSARPGAQRLAAAEGPRVKPRTCHPSFYVWHPHAEPPAGSLWKPGGLSAHDARGRPPPVTSRPPTHEPPPRPVTSGPPTHEPPPPSPLSPRRTSPPPVTSGPPTHEPPPVTSRPPTHEPPPRHLWAPDARAPPPSPLSPRRTSPPPCHLWAPDARAPPPVTSRPPTHEAPGTEEPARGGGTQTHPPQRRRKQLVEAEGGRRRAGRRPLLVSRLGAGSEAGHVTGRTTGDSPGPSPGRGRGGRCGGCPEPRAGMTPRAAYHVRRRGRAAARRARPGSPGSGGCGRWGRVITIVESLRAGRQPQDAAQTGVPVWGGGLFAVGNSCMAGGLRESPGEHPRTPGSRSGCRRVRPSAARHGSQYSRPEPTRAPADRGRLEVRAPGARGRRSVR